MLNLVIKSILQEFESKKERHVTHNETSDVAHDNEGEEVGIREEGAIGDPDNFGDWHSERLAMTREEVARLDASVLPLQGMLGKVRVQFVR